MNFIKTTFPDFLFETHVFLDIRFHSVFFLPEISYTSYFFSVILAWYLFILQAYNPSSIAIVLVKLVKLSLKFVLKYSTMSSGVAGTIGQGV